MRAAHLAIAASILLTIAAWNSLAIAEPRRMKSRCHTNSSAPSNGCDNQWREILSLAGPAVTIDVNSLAGTITFEIAEIRRKIACEPLGLRMFDNGV